MIGRVRWWIATQVNRLDRQCWADLVSWVLQRGKPRYYGRWPWQPRTPMCTLDAVRNGRCYCGKLARDGSIGQAGKGNAPAPGSPGRAGGRRG